MSIVSQDHQGVLISRKSVPALNEAVRITRQLRTEQIAMPANQPRTPVNYYFKPVKASASSVTIKDIRYRYLTTQGTISDQTKTIPTTDGTYYVYFEIAFSSGSYGTPTVEVSAVDTHPTLAVAGSSRTWRREICAVIISSNEISAIIPIWPGHLMEFGPHCIEDTISGMIESPSAKDYVIEQRAKFAGVIESVITQSGSGSADLKVDIDGTDVSFTGPTTSIAFGTSENIYTAVSNNTFSAGDKIKLEVSSISSCEDAAFTIALIREIE